MGGASRLGIPRHLRIRGRVWRVVLTPDPPRWRGRACYGLCRLNERRILVWARSGRSRRELEETFAHELLHALAGRSRGRWSAATEERIVEAMAEPLRALLSGRKWAQGGTKAGAISGKPKPTRGLEPRTY